MIQERKNKSLVWCKLPKAGLGNQLFPLLKAFVFGRLNNLPVVVTNYHQLKIGPYIRGEKNKRKYRHSFVFEKNLLGEWLDRQKVKPEKFAKVIDEPELTTINQVNTLFRFSQIPHWSDFFAGLKEHRQTTIELLHSILHPEVKEKLNNLTAGKIGVHVRMGDFRKLKAGEDFSKVGAVRTPENYFLDTLEMLQTVQGAAEPISIFTDGKPGELPTLSMLPGARIIEGNPDIVDLLLLSKCKIIIASAGSTFSYWAGFLSNSPLLLHPDHIHQPIRSGGSTEWTSFEGSPKLFQKLFFKESVDDQSP